MTIRFDVAMRGYLDVVRAALGAELAGLGQVVVVRDLRGRLRLVIEKRPLDRTLLDALHQRLSDSVGAFAGGAPLWGEDLLAPAAIFGAVDLCKVDGVAVLERTAMGADWTRPALPNEAPRPPRGTLYGIKGGVGRSLALCVWAHHLAKLGKKVLVVDLDLESPGVSSSLLPVGAGSSFGVVDWLAEDAVSQADDELVRLMVAPSPLADGTSGSILVAPCGSEPGGAGAPESDYLAKLSRAYIDAPSGDGRVVTFAERLARMLDRLESVHKPEVVLLDSRAGLHDVAAITLTRLSSMSFLFAMGTAQTWAGYRTLFRQWQRQPEVGKRVRERLRIVAAQVPETERDAYLERFELDAYSLFSDTLYEQAGPDRPEAFNFDIESRDAPHYRLPIYWSRALQDWNPLHRTVTDGQLQSALGEFAKEATDLLVKPGGDHESESDSEGI